MKEPDTPLYDKLAEYGEGRIYVTVFFSWMERTLSPEKTIADIDIQALIMEFLDIDMVALEKERRASADYECYLREKRRASDDS